MHVSQDSRTPQRGPPRRAGRIDMHPVLLLTMDEQKLIDKLRKVEALMAGATTAGEEEAASHAREALRHRLKAAEAIDPPREWTFRLSDTWHTRLFCALLRRYGIKPYRYRRQRYTTVVARVPERFVNRTLWPHYRELSKQLEAYLCSMTERIIKEAVHADTSDSDVIERKALPQAS